MNQLARLKNTVVGYFTPLAKRRRTAVATPAKDAEPTFLSPGSEPTMIGRFRDKMYISQDKNPRKRGRTEFEGEGSALSPDDSISRISFSEDEDEDAMDTSGGGVDAEVKHEVEEAIKVESDEDDEIEDDDQDAVAQAKVQEYLERQAELEMRKEDIEKARAAGDWHTDELFLYERLIMRSFEELIPLEWKIDFPTLPELLFTDEPAKTFINYNYISSARGELHASLHYSVSNIVNRC